MGHFNMPQPIQVDKLFRGGKTMRDKILDNWQEVFWLGCGLSFLLGCVVGWLI